MQDFCDCRCLAPSPSAPPSAMYPFFAVYDGHGGSDVAVSLHMDFGRLLAERIDTAIAAGTLNAATNVNAATSGGLHVDREGGGNGNDGTTGWLKRCYMDTAASADLSLLLRDHARRLVQVLFRALSIPI